MTHLPVLIVGAGPAGLMMACELKRHDIAFRLIDKKSEPTQGSNATWVQSRSLEIFDLIGIADQFLRKGHRCHAINFYEQGETIANLSLNQVDSNYPFILMLPQRETEAILSAKLAKSKIHVERSVELISIEQHASGVTSTLKHSDGRTEIVASNWVIACDGANSTIRSLCKIPLRGEDISEQFMVADAEMSSFLPDDEVHVFIDKGAIFPDKATIFSAFPWGSKQYRLNANLYTSATRQTFHEHEVKEMVAERTYGNFVAENVSWISPFWIHAKMVDELQDNAIFLVGDAAHTHSPISGQGMNTGLQDAFNLAWKLALVIKHNAHQSILTSYKEERYDIVKHIVELTSQLTHAALFEKSFFAKLRQFSKSLSQPGTLKNITNELTQTGIRYMNSSIVDYSETPPNEAPKQGERAPDVIIHKTKHLYQYLNQPVHHVLLFAGVSTDEVIIDKLISLQTALHQNYPELIKAHIVATKRIKAKSFIHDIDYKLHARYSVQAHGVYVIRPDNYIAYYSRDLALAGLEHYFQILSE